MDSGDGNTRGGGVLSCYDDVNITDSRNILYSQLLRSQFDSLVHDHISTTEPKTRPVRRDDAKRAPGQNDSNE